MIKLDFKDIVTVIVIIVIALGAGLLSAYQYVEGVKKDKENDKTTQQLIKAQQEVNTINQKISLSQEKALLLSEELKKSQQQSIEKSDDLINAQTKINDLQSEIINQVIGKGYPTLKLMNSHGDNFKIYLQGSSEYPIFKVYFRLIDAEKLKNCSANISSEKVEINQSCYNSSLIIDPNQSIDVNGKLMHFTGHELAKKDYYLVTEFMCKNTKAIQYSIVKYDGKNLSHNYRIYEVSREDASFIKLLGETDSTIPEKEYEERFYFKKTTIIDYSK